MATTTNTKVTYIDFISEEVAERGKAFEETRDRVKEAMNRLNRSESGWEGSFNNAADIADEIKLAQQLAGVRAFWAAELEIAVAELNRLVEAGYMADNEEYNEARAQAARYNLGLES